MFALDQEFHLSMYQPAGRPSLIDTISALRDRCRAYMHMASAVGIEHMEQSQVTHQQLVKACKDRNVEAAKSLIAHDIRRMLGPLASILHTSDEATA
jgi:DNA-binding GntR family transcriptional regulator